MPQVSIILPTYNELENIGVLIENILGELEGVEGGFEIIVVDDDSPDGTGELVDAISDKHDEVRLFIRSGEHGLAKSIRKGIEESVGDVIVVMDSDLSHPARIIPGLVEALSEFDLAVASRYVKGGDMDSERYKFYLSKLLNKAIRHILGISVRDSTGGFIAIKRSVIEDLDYSRIFYGYGDYCFRLLYLLKKKNIRISEVPFYYHRRVHGQSKTHVYEVGLKYLLNAFEVRLRLK